MPLLIPPRVLVSAGLLALCALLHTHATAAPKERISVIYARDLAEEDDRLDYPVRLLELALKKSGVNFDLQADARPMPQGAAIKRLASGINVNVVWSMTTKEREEQLRPIRIPIDKGLFGYRIAFVSHKKRDALAKIRTLRDLSLLTAGQGHDWPDTDILRANGLKVNTASAFPNLFPMMDANRFDYFPRSVLEIWDELKMPMARGAVVEQRLLLHYPAAVYFFVNKNDQPLAEVLEKGLKNAIADGSFDALYYAHYGAIIKRANLPGRTRIELKNPLLPKETPLSNKSLWLDVNALPK